MDPVFQSYFRERGQRVVEALKKREFNAHYVATQAAAREMVLKEIPARAVVGIGGSVTVREMNLLADLEGRGNRVIDHWNVPPFSPESYQLRVAQQTCDVFLTSTNAVTQDGQLVNTDGGGQRVNAMAFGPRKAIVVAGINKIVPDLESAFRRIKDVAVQLNCRRINISPPCILAGKCIDCRVHQRVCRITSIIEWKPPFFSDYLIIIVGENLGY